MTNSPHAGKRLLVISNDAERAAQTARMLNTLGYNATVSEPASALSRCCEMPPDAAVVTAADEDLDGVHERLREVKSLQRRGELPPFPIIAAGHPDRRAVVELVDGIVLEPDRLTSFAVEIAKQVDLVISSALPPAHREEA